MIAVLEVEIYGGLQDYWVRCTGGLKKNSEDRDIIVWVGSKSFKNGCCDQSRVLAIQMVPMTIVMMTLLRLVVLLAGLKIIVLAVLC